MKKKFILLTILPFILTGCGNKSEIVTPPIEVEPEVIEYIVNFYNLDGKKLQTKSVVEGQCAKYDGPKPTLASDSQYIFTFKGRNNDLSKPIKRNTNFIAQYDTKNVRYHAKFLNYDNSLLYEADYPYGFVPSYIGDIPTRSGDDRTQYAFNGWDKKISGITKDIQYIATYKKQEFVYAIFKDRDDSLLYKEKVLKGETPKYLGKKPDDGMHTYDKVESFYYWDNDIGPIFEDTTYKAVYLTTYYYDATFLNGDGTKMDTLHVEWGEPIQYNKIPTKASEEHYEFDKIFEFDSWDKNLRNGIYEDTTFKPRFNERIVNNADAKDGNVIREYFDANSTKIEHTLSFVESISRNSPYGYPFDDVYTYLKYKPDSYEFSIQRSLSSYDGTDNFHFITTFNLKDKTITGECFYKVYGYNTEYKSRMDITTSGGKFVSMSNKQIIISSSSSIIKNYDEILPKDAINAAYTIMTSRNLCPLVG